MDDAGRAPATPILADGQVVGWRGSKEALQALGFAPGLAFPGEAGGPRRSMTVTSSDGRRLQVRRSGAQLGEWIAILTPTMGSAQIQASRRDRTFQVFLRQVQVKAKRTQ